MNMSRIKTISVICFLFLTFSIFSSIVNAQTSANSPAKSGQGESEQTMHALLNEVRELRLAIQQSNLSVYRTQVVVERMRLQQQLVDRLSERLRGTREQIANWKRELGEWQEETKMIERRINRTTDATERSNLEEQQERFKSRLAAFALENTRMQEQESQLTGQLNIEQAKLADFNDQLDTLQRELEIQPAENQKGKALK
jgi:chromosome segregation ATPase